MAETVIMGVVNTHRQRSGTSTPPREVSESQQYAHRAMISPSILGASMPAGELVGGLPAYSVGGQGFPQVSLFLNVFSEVRRAMAQLPGGHESAELRCALTNLLTTLGDLQAISSEQLQKLAKDLMSAALSRQQTPDEKMRLLHAQAPPQVHASGLDTGAKALDEPLKAFISQELRNLEASFDGKIQRVMDAVAEHTKTGVASIVEEMVFSQNPDTSRRVASPDTTATTGQNLDTSRRVASPDTTATAGNFENGKSLAWDGEQTPRYVPLDAQEHIQTYMQPLRPHNWFRLALERKLHAKSFPHMIAEFMGLAKRRRKPHNRLVDCAEHSLFHTVVYLAIAGNIFWSMFESDRAVHKALQDPPEAAPLWWGRVNLAWSIFFGVEIGFRLLAYRLWFFLAPDWLWNLFDLFLVTLGIINSVFGPDNAADFVFLRTLKGTRVIRMARVVRVFNAFDELRKLMFSVAACLKSLFWCVLFLITAMIFFSLVILQGVRTTAENEQSNTELLHRLRQNYNGIGQCISTLLIVMFGPEWYEYQEILGELGFVSAAVMPLFLIFIQVGITNIVVAVFANDASTIRDHDIIVAAQISEVEAFVEAMLTLWKECAGVESIHAKLTKDVFLKYIRQENVQAYLASHQIDTSHARVIYTICDEDNSGEVDITEFVLRLLMIKGSSKALDTTLMVSALSQILAATSDQRSPRR